MFCPSVSSWGRGAKVNFNPSSRLMVRYIEQALPRTGITYNNLFDSQMGQLNTLFGDLSCFCRMLTAGITICFYDGIIAIPKRRNEKTRRRGVFFTHPQIALENLSKTLKMILMRFAISNKEWGRNALVLTNAPMDISELLIVSDIERLDNFF